MSRTPVTQSEYVQSENGGALSVAFLEDRGARIEVPTGISFQGLSLGPTYELRPIKLSMRKN